jgi:hypothetical protein
MSVPVNTGRVKSAAVVFYRDASFSFFGDLFSEHPHSLRLGVPLDIGQRLADDVPNLLLYLVRHR